MVERQGSDHIFDLSWRHGSQLITLVNELDMIVVTTAKYAEWISNRELQLETGRSAPQSGG